MVQEQARAALGPAGRARDHDHRRLLGEGAGDGVDQVEGAGAVGHRGHADACRGTAPAASAAKPTAGSWLSVWSGRMRLSSTTLKNGSAKSPGMPKISPAP